MAQIQNHGRHADRIH